MLKIRTGMVLSALFAGTSFGAVAHAQSTSVPAQPEEAKSGGVSEIIVTAQRREQKLQDVPVAISAATGEMLKSSGLTNTEQLGTLVPGLVMTKQRVSSAPYLRGVGTQNVAVGDEPNVSTYVDGVYMASNAVIAFDLNNIERIEVLRGPQGTLFGRNATGGAIQVITRKPSHETRVEGNFGYENYETIRGQLYATTGLSDNMAIDLALTGTHQGRGWGKQIYTNQDVYFKRNWGVRSKLLWEPSPDTTVTLAGDYSENHGDIGKTRGIICGTVTANGTNSLGAIVAAGTPSSCGFFDAQDSLTDRTSLIKSAGASLVINHDFGDLSLTSTSAYRYSFAHYVTDTDAGQPIVSSIDLLEHTDTLQQEFLLQGRSGGLNYTAGLFLFYANGKHDPLLKRNAYSPSPFTNVDELTENKTFSYAPFAQLSYDFGQGTTITGGLRFTSDRREFVGSKVADPYTPEPFVFNPGAVLFHQDEGRTYKKVTWRGSIDHRFSPNLLVYGSVSRGFKSGVYNSTSVGTSVSNPPVRPETLDAYEIGFKSDLLDRQLRFNVSAFHYNYKDIQLFSIVGATAFLINAAKGRINGVDIESVFQPHIGKGDLRLTTNMSFVDAKYTNFPNAQFFIPKPASACGPATSPNPSQTTGAPTGGNLQCVGDASGHTMIKAPKFTLSADLFYALPISETDKATFDITWSHNSGYFFDPDSRLKQKAYNLVNAQVGLSFADGRYGVRAYVRNLLNTKYVPAVQTSTLTDSFIPGDPMTYGLAVDFKF
ncbi:MAG: TonB-dependent receptor [Novosphingobium sp.]